MTAVNRHLFYTCSITFTLIYKSDPVILTLVCVRGVLCAD